MTVTFTDKKGEAQTLEVDYVLSAVGRVPNSGDLGLDTVGIKTDAQGFITVDERLQTNVPGVYAIGDVAGKQLLVKFHSEQLSRSSGISVCCSGR